MTYSDHQDTSIVQLTAFRVGDEEYVVDILRIHEIIRPMKITPIRHGPRFVEGVINLRGAIIPVIDMRRRFGLPADDLPRRKIIVLSVEGRTLGLIVDQVTEVVRVPRNTIRPAPGLLEGDRAPYFVGVVHHQGRTLILLNVRHVIASDEEIDPPAAEEMLGEIL